MPKRVERPVRAEMVEKTKAKAKGRTKQGSPKERGRTKGKEKGKDKSKKKKGARARSASSDGSSASSSGDEGRAAAMALRASGDVRDLSFCLRPKTPSGVMFHLIDHSTVWEPLEALADSWTLIECVRFRTWSLEMYGW